MDEMAQIITLQSEVSWLEYTMAIVAMFSALSAVAAAIISYVVYRKNYYPQVIVYLEHGDIITDINIAVENIKESPALDVSFELSRPLERSPYRTALLDTCGITPNGFLDMGIKLLEPRGKRTMKWDDGNALIRALRCGGKEDNPAEEVQVNVTYYRKAFFSGKQKPMHASYPLAVSSFALSHEIGVAPHLDAEGVAAYKATLEGLMQWGTLSVNEYDEEMKRIEQMEARKGGSE